MIKIVADTLAGLPQSFVRQHKIPVLPQIVIFGERSYRDDTEIDTATFLRMLRASPVLPKTSAPQPALYTPIYKRLLAEGHSILVIAPSSVVSGTYRSATVAAQDFPGADIHIFDSLTLSGPLAAMVMCAVRWADAGVNLETILARLQGMITRQRIYFMVNTLEYLHKGGRIGGAQALIGSILQVKPILTLRNGQVEPCETQRTYRKALQYVVDMVLNECPRGAESFLAVLQVDALEEAQKLAGQFGGAFGLDSVPVYELPPAIATHGGPGILGVSFFAE